MTIEGFRRLLWPAGRAGRRELLWVATALMALQFMLFMLPAFGVELPEPLEWMLGGVLLWAGFVATARRLHDLGLSGWWVPAAFLALCVWSALVALVAVFGFGVGAITPQDPAYPVVLSILMLPLMGAALWLHLASGQPFINAYGRPPEDVVLVHRPSGEAGARGPEEAARRGPFTTSA